MIILDSICTKKALVVGDIILARYVWGDATRFSPEAPVPVVEIERDTYTAGGAANPALNVKSLGAAAEICGWIGNDEPGRLLLRILEKAGVAFHSCRLLRVHQEHRLLFLKIENEYRKYIFW